MSSQPLGSIEYVLFDMDGLLMIPRYARIVRCSGVEQAYFSQKIYTDVTNLLLERYGYTKKFTWAIKADTMGKSATKGTEALFAHYPGIESKVSIPEFMAARQEISEQRFKQVEPMKGAIALVKGLYDAGVPIAIATGSNMESFKWKTGHLPEMFSLFPPANVISADMLSRGKPFPDIYLAAAKTLGKDVGTPESATEAQLAERKKGLVFEDAIPGVEAGVAAGMNVVWIPDEGLRTVYPDQTFGSAQLLTSLEEFKSEEWGLPKIDVAAQMGA